jgi:uncharacterized membrane protein (UPF0182 family)
LRERRHHVKEGRRYIGWIISIVLAVLAGIVAAGGKLIVIHHWVHGNILVNDVLSLILMGFGMILERIFGIGALV